MMMNPNDLEALVEPLAKEAVRRFWLIRENQKQKQEDKGTRDAGDRGTATGGKHLDGFLELFAKLIESAGVVSSDIYINKKSTVPGYYRATKDWDLLVVSKNQLVLAIEMKSQAGSFGNNLNNRSEEALGSSEDLLTAHREGAFGARIQPWLGYAYLLEDCNAATSPVRVSEPHFKVFDEFRNSGYSKRVGILCRKLMVERKYNAACLVMSKRDEGREGQYSEPYADLSLRTFCRSLIAHLWTFKEEIK